MVSVKAARSANSALKNQHESLTAVFAGATSGIGLETLKLFTKNTPKPTAVIVGRSRSKFEPALKNLQAINPNGQYHFIEAEISLIKNVDAACAEIKKHTSKIDLLYLSQGFLNLGTRENNEDGLDVSYSLRYYGRVRFTQNLLPILSPEARVISGTSLSKPPASLSLRILGLSLTSNSLSWRSRRQTLRR
jgi:NAD(P)-dependent dehydrogenase (short-subunit alcohol dehydrogenase family)